MKAADFLGSADDLGGAQSAASFLDAAEPKKQNKGIAGDLATDLKRGFESIPGAVTGLLDIPVAAVTGRPMVSEGWQGIGDLTGFKPGQWSKDAQAEYSPARQAANAEIDAAWKDGSSGDIAGAYLKNPAKTLGTIVESAPSMVAGGLAARGIVAASKLAPAIAAGIGEGGIMAGQQMSQLTEAGVDPRTAAAASAGTGVLGGLIGAAGGKVAQRFGVIDPDTAIAGGAGRAVSDATGMAAAKETGKRIIGGGISEGVFEELPQSIAEQGLSNLAQDKPLTEGMARSAVEGTLAGGLMGGAFNALPGKKPDQPTITDDATDPQNPPLALPAPTYTGTPSDQVLQAEAERQNAVDAAQSNADALYAERDAIEAKRAELRAGGVLSRAVDAGIDSGATNMQALGFQAGPPLVTFPDGSTMTQAEYAQRNAEKEQARLDAMVQDAPLVRMMDRAKEQAPAALEQNDLAGLIAAERTDLNKRRAEQFAKVRAARAERAQQAVAGDMAQDELAPSMAQRIAESRTDDQLQALTGEDRTPAIRQAAQAEIAKRQSAQSVTPQQTQEQPVASEQKPNPAQQQQARSPSPIERRDDLVGAIMRVTNGQGISAGMAQTITGDKAGSGNAKLRGLFTNQGTADLGDIAELLKVEEGYSVRDGDHLAELVREASAGNMTYSMERTEREAAENAVKEYRGNINKRAEELGLKKIGGKRTLDIVEADIAAKEKEIADIEAQQEREAIQAANIVEDGEVSEAEFMALFSKIADYTEDEINAAIVRSEDKANQQAEARSVEISEREAQGNSQQGDGVGSKTEGTGNVEAGTRGSAEGGITYKEGKGLAKGKWFALSNGEMSNAEDTKEKAAESLQKIISAKQANEDRRVALDDLARSVSDKIKNGTQPTDKELYDLFGLDKQQDYVFQEAVGAFLVKHLGVSRNKIHESLGKAGGVRRSDFGGERNIAYPRKLHEVFGKGFDLTQQTNAQAAEQFAQQQAGENTEPTKEQADRERDAVPFSMQQQSQPKPQGVQTGLFTADGRATKDAVQAPSVESKKPDEAKPAPRERGAADFSAGRERIVPDDLRNDQAIEYNRGYAEAKNEADYLKSREGKEIVVLPSEFPLHEVDASYSHISHSGTGRARSDRDAFVETVNGLYDAAMAKAETDEQKAAAKRAAISFKDEYLRRLQPVIRVRGQTYSGFVAGRAKLNSKQADSRNDALSRALDSFAAWQRSAEPQIMQAVLDARNEDQRAAERKARDDKAAKKKAELHTLLGKLMDFKKGDDVRFGNYQVSRVSLDKAGYPSSVTVDATDLTDNKFDIARILFAGDKDKLREAVDEIRASRQAPSSEEATPASREDESSDNTPRQYSTMADIDSAIESIFDGTVSLADYKAAFNGLMANKEAIVAELGKMTIPQLHERFGKQPYGRPEKKGEIVERAFEIIRNAFALRRSFGPNSYTMSAGGLAKFEADKLSALADMVNASTAEDLKAFADEIGKTRAARQEKIAAAQDPKTIEDFDNALRLKKAEGMTFSEARMSLTPEQRAEYDRLKGIESRNQRKARADQQKTDVRVASQTTEGQVIETKHTKTGVPLFVVKAAERVDRDVYTLWNTTAKRMGGYYSAFRGNGAVPGFQFKTRENADAFLAFIGGNAEAAKEAVQERRDSFADDRSQSAVERLNEMADRLEERADESLGRERKANTERRARFAASAEAAANGDKALAKTMRNIAKAIGDGTAKFLDRVRQKAQVEMLRSAVSAAQYAELQKKYPTYGEQERHKGEAPTAETADHARWPSFTAYRSDLAVLGRELSQIDGAKKLGQALLKVADDVSDAYQKFAKDNLHKVSVFSAKREGSDESRPAVFSTAEKAEAVIAKSGYKGKAAVISFRRGEHLVIMGPTMAREAGVWSGDDDKRITLKPEFAEEIVAKNKAMGKRNRLTMPYVFDNVSVERARWKGLGIESAAEMRAALREFIALREAPSEADKIKAMERAMIGRKNDGLDFFPTPAGTAQSMIDAAEIAEGMSVLEPSAGMGHIAEQIREVTSVDPDVIEFNSDRRELLEAKGFNVVGSDFLEVDGRYDRIIMNPPFSNRRDAEHVQHAYSLLEPGGRLVAIMGEGVFFGQDAKAKAFREWLDEVGGTSEKLEEGTFLDPSLPVNTATNARMVVVDKAAGKVAPADNEGVGNIATPATISPADKAIYGMAVEGKSAGDILKFIASASRSPFNRQVAKLLLKTGIAPSITVGDGKGWKMNAGDGNKYAAGYNPKTNTIAFFRPASAERNALHELIHAASLKALSGKGLAAAQMNALYQHVKKTGKLKGMYGMSDVDEFIAEAFSNPQFQQRLKAVPSAPVGGKASSAWNWFVRIVRGILGIPKGQDNALSQALEIGVDVMREDMKLRKADAGVPFSEITGEEIERTLGRTVQEKASNWMRANLQGRSFKNDATGWDISISRKGINKAMSHGAKETHSRSVAAIPDLLKNAVLVASEPSRNADDKMDVAAVHHFYAPLRVGGESYIARIVVKETRSGQKFYDYDTSDEISPTKQAADAHLPKEGAATGNAGRTMSMAKLLSHVKAEHGGTDPKFIRYNVADEGWSVAEQAKEAVMRLAGRPMLDPSDPFAAENARLREQDQSLWSKAKKQLRRYLAPGGLLPQSVFAEKIKRDSEFQAVEFDVRHLIGGLEQAVKADFGMAFDKLSKEQMRPITEALAGNVPASLPEATKTAAVAMRQYIDGMSTEYLKIIQEKIDAKMLKALESGKDSDKAQAINDIELFEKIKGNIGRYVHRSYQAFDDPKWFEKVPAPVLNASRLYLKQGYMEAGETDAKAAQLAEVTLHEILKNGTAYDSMESFIAESKLGAKDLSVLMRRKEVPAQIRALLGEYHDARLNFTKSATKMGRLIWNTRFLDRVRDIGMGSFFFDGKDRPPAATTQIAADGSEVYAPLNGLWTFPEIAQSFKEALGKEQMSDLYRAIVRANGLVKYGKTVLAPTTAMRNWQSAMFFSLANGHFDLTQMKKSISAFREQVSQKATGQDLKYLRHLKQLGVVYDTPYAGEMARLMEDARMDELLSSDKGDAVRWFRKANQLAQGFYTFGDDFWKIIGFENEKAGLMKAGLSLQEAEIEAAKRIRDTYPTYSMVGRGVQWLSRFPLAGTFVSFPAEIIRTSSNMLRTVAADLKSDNPKLRELGMKRAAGMAFVSAAFYGLAALSMAMAGVGDDEDEVIRDLAPEWQKNSTFLYLGRDEKGNLRYFDMSFLDPYGYWKRPITAMMRNQPWEDSLSSGLRGMLEPFLGADIAAAAIFEAVANQKENGSKVYKEKDGVIDQTIDIADHLRKALQPGVAGNIERLVNAATDVRRSSGQPYSMEDELVALAGWRATTIDPKTALYYRSFEFTDSLAEARKTLTDTLRDANSVSPEDIKDARERAKAKQDQAFIEMSRLVGAAESAGMSKMQIVQTLRLSNISQANVGALMRGVTPAVTVTPELASRAVKQAKVMRGDEFAAEVSGRYRQAMTD